MFEILEADIVVMQETKIQRRDLSDDMVLVPGWDVYFSLPKYKKGMHLLSTHYVASISVANNMQATPELQSTPGPPSAVRYGRRRASLGFSARRRHRPASEICRLTNKSAGIRGRANSRASRTKQRWTPRVAA